jgi:murein DD-endopeptidase MepM/ murein hydrolase activator NlpD
MLDTHVYLASPVKLLKITSGFGNRVHPVTKKVEFHNGIDIDGIKDEYIYASDIGYVVEVSYNDIGGKQVIIQYDNNIRCGYAHLSTVLVKEGDIVKKHTKIGRIGNTGRCTGYHLHFTIKNKDNEFVNPLPYLIPDTSKVS